MLALAASASTLAYGQFSRTVFATGLARPVAIAQPPNDNTRLFVVEQYGTSGSTVLNNTQGRISVLNRSTGALISRFLVINGVNSGSEEGLLGLAFHPNYATNGFFYVYLCTGGSAQRRTEVRRYSVDPNNPNLALTTGVVIMQIPQPFSNHNGGTIRFGPDGYLWLMPGDGGSGNDPGNVALNVNSLLGKILRIDVNGDDFPADANRDYRIPPDNPYAGATTGLDEIYAIGLRNPWKWDFDEATRNGFSGLTIADVGQVAREEVNYMPWNTPGVNYGWRQWEGRATTGLSGQPGVPTPTGPVFDYGRSVGASITGGNIYRGTDLGVEAWGDYFLGDAWNSWVNRLEFSYNLESGLLNATFPFTNIALTGNIAISTPVAIEKDNLGEVFICELGGTVSRLTRTAGASRAASGTLQLQGLAEGAGPKGVNVEIRMNSNPANVITLQVGLNPNGTFRIPVPTGAGTLSVDHGSWVRRTVSFDTTTANATGLNLVLSNGDTNQDGIVDGNDVNAVLSAFGAEAGAAPYTLLLDPNRDGIIDGNDVNVILASFGLEDENP